MVRAVSTHGEVNSCKTSVLKLQGKRLLGDLGIGERRMQVLKVILDRWRVCGVQDKARWCLQRNTPVKVLTS
jgi:hypothetical protein